MVRFPDQEPLLTGPLGQGVEHNSPSPHTGGFGIVGRLVTLEMAVAGLLGPSALANDPGIQERAVLDADTPAAINFPWATSRAAAARRKREKAEQVAAVALVAHSEPITITPGFPQLLPGIEDPSTPENEGPYMKRDCDPTPKPGPLELDINTVARQGGIKKLTPYQESREIQIGSATKTADIAVRWKIPLANISRVVKLRVGPCLSDQLVAVGYQVARSEGNTNPAQRVKKQQSLKITTGTGVHQKLLEPEARLPLVVIPQNLAAASSQG